MYTRKKTNWRPRLETLEARRLLSIYADFNGDGFDDMAIGVPGEDNGEGTVHVIYGSASGLTVTGSQIWTQNLVGTDVSETGDNFGAVLAGGDFNNDGFADLAVGVPNEDVGTVIDAGMVHFIVGSAAGLTSANDYVMHRNINRVRDICEPGDLFGSSLAAGDFNNDGFTDLAVGVLGHDLPGQGDAGGIHIFYGGGQGIKPPGNQTFDLDSPNVIGTGDNLDRFGFSMTSGDFNNDARDDLAVSAINGDTPSVADAGTVNVFYGSVNGISPAGSQQWTQDSTSIADAAEFNEQFGRGLAAGDIDNDGFADLVIGVPLEDVAIQADAGALHVIYGSAGGLAAAGSQFFTQGSISGAADEPFDYWGYAVAVGDFDSDTFKDVAVGAPFEDVGSVNAAGTVIVLYADSSGLTTTAAVIITQDTLGTGDASEDTDLFGQTLSAGDFNNNGRDDLVISAPEEDIGTSIVDTGRVWSLYGASGSGFTGIQSWGQDTPGIADVSETSDNFGSGLDSSAGKSAAGSGREQPRTFDHRRCRFRHAHQQTQQTPQPERPALAG